METKALTEAILFRFAYDSYRDRQAWERARIQAYYSLAPHMKKGRNIKPKELIPLTWDKEDGYENMSLDDIREQFKNSPALNHVH